MYMLGNEISKHRTDPHTYLSHLSTKHTIRMISSYMTNMGKLLGWMISSSFLKKNYKHIYKYVSNLNEYHIYEKNATIVSHFGLLYSCTKW